MHSPVILWSNNLNCELRILWTETIFNLKSCGMLFFAAEVVNPLHRCSGTDELSLTGNSSTPWSTSERLTLLNPSTAGWPHQLKHHNSSTTTVFSKPKINHSVAN
jgi:hypothetical protein